MSLLEVLVTVNLVMTGVIFWKIYGAGLMTIEYIDEE